MQPAGGAAGLNGFDAPACQGAFSSVVDKGLQRCTQGHLDEPGVLDFSLTSEITLVPWTLSCRFSKPCRPMARL